MERFGRGTIHALGWHLIILMMIAMFMDDEEKVKSSDLFKRYGKFIEDAFLIINTPGWKWKMSVPAVSTALNVVSAATAVTPIESLMSGGGVSIPRYKVDSKYGEAGSWKGWGRVSRIIPKPFRAALKRKKKASSNMVSTVGY
jgi:hypothetical protein